jgi:Rrf2 family protein
MLITQESDYALRIVCLLAKENKTIDAGTISNIVNVTPRFALKILHKLVIGGIVRSYKGANGGYRFESDPKIVTVLDVINLIDGPIAISKCVGDSTCCSMKGDNKSDCRIHHLFSSVNSLVSEKLGAVTIEMVM